MGDNYNDIMHLSRPKYDEFPPMSMHDRAAQFSPFAALVGYDDAVAETARLTDSRIELTEDQERELNAKLNMLLDRIHERPEVTVTFFMPDERKSGGSYTEKTGIVRIFDSYANELEFVDRQRVKVLDIIDIRISDTCEE